jgi:hypothetical protein
VFSFTWRSGVDYSPTAHPLVRTPKRDLISEKLTEEFDDVLGDLALFLFNWNLIIVGKMAMRELACHKSKLVAVS